MMNLRISIMLLLVIITIYSCKKNAVDVDSNYEGEWHSASTIGTGGVIIEEYFIIDGNSSVYGEQCELFQTGSNCFGIYMGEVKINRKESKIEFGKTFKGDGKIILNIDTPPHLNSDSKWECTLHERVYIKS